MTTAAARWILGLDFAALAFFAAVLVVLLKREGQRAWRASGVRLPE